MTQVECKDTNMLNKALKSLQMVKLAKRSSFYYLSFLDPKADAYDATKNEIYRLQDSYANTINPDTGLSRFDEVNSPDSIFNKAIAANDELAKKRRAMVMPYYTAGSLVGGGLGAALGGTAGYFGSKVLGFGRKGKLLSAIGGTLLGGALGSNIGGSYASNRYVNSESAPVFEDGTSILHKLNKDSEDLYGNHGTGTPFNMYAARNAVTNAEKRKKGDKD